ncbi:hypothetical protein U6G28_02345 [Actinomycetaceae bacterium MB13-C1-2]|nr:hypothetical protein U6G28_02345 [Actinomycetaceae bacterium MB13-C1-2]
MLADVFYYETALLQPTTAMTRRARCGKQMDVVFVADRRMPQFLSATVPAEALRMIGAGL